MSNFSTGSSKKSFLEAYTQLTGKPVGQTFGHEWGVHGNVICVFAKEGNRVLRDVTLGVMMDVGPQNWILSKDPKVGLKAEDIWSALNKGKEVVKRGLTSYLRNRFPEFTISEGVSVEDRISKALNESSI